MRVRRFHKHATSTAFCLILPDLPHTPGIYNNLHTRCSGGGCLMQLAIIFALAQLLSRESRPVSAWRPLFSKKKDKKKPTDI